MVSTFVFLRHSSQSYTHQLLGTFESLRGELSASVEGTFRPGGSAVGSELRCLDTNILDSASQLRRSYVQAFFEPRYSKLHVKELHSFMAIIDRIRTELSCEPHPSSFGDYSPQYDCDQGVKPFRYVFAPTQPRSLKYTSLSMVLQRQLRSTFVPPSYWLNVRSRMPSTLNGDTAIRPP